MDSFYEEFKPKSKFLAIVAKFKRPGLAKEGVPGDTTATTPAATTTGTTPAAGASAPNPALAQAQDKVNKDVADLKKKQKTQAQQDINLTNSQMGQLKNQLNSQDPAQKAMAQAAIATANAKLQQAQAILKQP
jgi:hypothetical protein